MRILLAVLLCVGVCSCRRNDFRTVHIYVPGMKNSACAQVIVNSLTRRQEISPDQIRVDLPERVVVVRYDSIKLSVKNLEFLIADAGFAANEVPTTARAVNALPPACEVPQVPVGGEAAGRSIR